MSRHFFNVIDIAVIFIFKLKQSNEDFKTANSHGEDVDGQVDDPFLKELTARQTVIQKIRFLPAPALCID